jgi:hypothetical protein
MARFGNRKGESAFVAALAAGDTVKDAAAKAGIGARTAYRRVQDPALRQEVAQMRTEMLERTQAKMADTMVEAADTLRQLLRANGESVRLGAARSVLELGNKLRETVEFERRLQEVEERLERNR